MDSFVRIDDELKFSLIDFIDECNKNDNLSIFYFFDALLNNEIKSDIV